MQSFQTGVILDTRTPEQKSRDYTQREILASAAVVDWKEKDPSKWRKFPIFNQNGSGSCVAQTLAKLLGVLYWLKNGVYVHFSATHIYQRRSNKPAGGMGGDDAFKIAQQGVTLEALVPSQDMSDSQMDAIEIPQYKKDVGAIFKMPKYVSMPIGDIDAIASTIQATQKAVMVWVYFRASEWTDVPRIDGPLDLYHSKTLRHSIAAVDFFMYKGQKALLIDDSWGIGYGTGGQRVLTEAFFKERNFYAAYPVNFAFEDQEAPSIPKPRFTFTRALKFGDTHGDVVELQRALRFFGTFPKNADATGYYGAVTAKSLLDWQKKYDVSTISELEALAGRSFGPKSMARMNGLLA